MSNEHKIQLFVDFVVIIDNGMHENKRSNETKNIQQDE